MGDLFLSLVSMVPTINNTIHNFLALKSGAWTEEIVNKLEEAYLGDCLLTSDDTGHCIHIRIISPFELDSIASFVNVSSPMLHQCIAALRDVKVNKISTKVDNSDNET